MCDVALEKKESLLTSSISVVNDIIADPEIERQTTAVDKLVGCRNYETMPSLTC